MSQHNTAERHADVRRGLTWPQLSVVIGVFLGSVVLALRAAQAGGVAELLRDPLILLIPLGVFALIMLRWPQLGLVGLIIAGIAIPFRIGTGTTTRLNSAVLLLGLLLVLWLFKMFVEQGRIYLMPSRTVLPLLLFVLVAILSFAIGQLPWYVFADKASLNAQLGGLAVFILAAGACLLVGNQLRELRWLEAMVWIFLALGAVHIIGYIVPGLGQYTSRIIQRDTFTHSVFWIWLAVLAFSQAFFNHKLHPGWRFALVILFLGTTYVSVIRDGDWTSGWLPAFVGLFAILWVSRSPLAWLSIVAGIALVIAKLDSFQNLLMAGNEYSLMTRLEAWRIVGEIVRVNPLFGLGPANYYWYTPLFPILGYSVEFNSHNNYVDMVAQIGLLGLACFLWFAWELGRVGWGLRFQVPSGFAQAYVYGALGGLAAMLTAGMLGDWLLPFIYNIGIGGFRASLLGWVFLSGLLALEQIFTRPGTQTEG